MDIMRKIIRHLRNQPEHMRLQIVQLSVLVAGVVLVFLWAASFGATFKDSPPIQAQFSDELKPFAALRDNFVEGYKSISANALDSAGQ